MLPGNKTIVHVVDYFHPMMGYQENNIAKLQSKAGNDVYIVTSKSMTPWYNVDKKTIKDGDADLQKIGCSVIRLPAFFEYSHRIWLKGLGKTISEIKPDWIHVHGYFTLNSLRIALLKSKLKFKLLVDDHMLYIAITNLYAKLVYPVFKSLVSPYIRKQTDHFVAVAEETKDFMQDKYGITEDIHVIPLGVHTGGIKKPEDDRKLLRQKIGLLPEDKILIYTGKMDSYKDPLKALKAAFLSWERGTKFKFIFVGGGDEDYINNLKNIASSSEYSQNIKIIPPVKSDDLKKYFNMADVAIWPCQSSMSAFEAMAYGTPVILSDSVENCQRVSKGSGLIYDDSSSGKTMSDCICELINNDKKRSLMAEKGLLITKELDWVCINNSFMDLMR